MARHPIRLMALEPPPPRPAARIWALGAALAVILAGLAIALQGAFIPAKAAVAQALLERAWARSAAGEVAAKPWPWADTWPVARIEAPRLEARAIVLHEAGGEAMAFGPAWLAQTAEPGHPGVSVIAAHRDTHFRFLKDLRPGDALTVTTADGAVHAFVVAGHEIVRADKSGIVAQGGAPRLALVTCFPFNAKTRGPLRYVVWADAATV